MRRTSSTWTLLVVLAACGSPPGDAQPVAGDSTVVGTEGYIAMPDGERLYFRREGNGEQAVLLTPGLFLHGDLGRLTAGRTLIFLDPRNRGRSDPVEDSTLLTIQQEVRDLETVRQHFGFERVSLVGYSYAGLLMMLYALEHPDRVERVVQLGPVPRRYGTEYPASLAATEPPEAAPLAAELAAMRERGEDWSDPRAYCEKSWQLSRIRLVGDARNADRLGPGFCHLDNELPTSFQRQIRFHFASVRELDVPAERFRELRLPVLTIHGTQDRNAPYAGGREWALTLPDARLLTVEGAAHQAWVEAPELVLPAIDAFLRGEWPVAAERVSTLERE